MFSEPQIAAALATIIEGGGDQSSVRILAYALGQRLALQQSVRELETALAAAIALGERLTAYAQASFAFDTRAKDSLDATGTLDLRKVQTVADEYERAREAIAPLLAIAFPSQFKSIANSSDDSPDSEVDAAQQRNPTTKDN